MEEKEFKKQIKEAKKEIRELKCSESKWYNLAKEMDEAVRMVNEFLESPMVGINNYIGWADYSIEQLKQSQKQLAISELGKLVEFVKTNESPSFSQRVDGYWFLSARKLLDYLHNQIKELGGEE
jgi:hypothetical protein